MALEVEGGKERGGLTAIHRPTHGFTAAHPSSPAVAAMNMKTTASSLRESRSVDFFLWARISAGYCDFFERGREGRSEGMKRKEKKRRESNVRKQAVNTSSAAFPSQMCRCCDRQYCLLQSMHVFRRDPRFSASPLLFLPPPASSPSFSSSFSAASASAERFSNR